MKLLVRNLCYRPNNFLPEIEGVEYVVAPTPEEALRAAADIDAAIDFCSEAFINATPKLHWVQMLFVANWVKQFFLLLHLRTGLRLEYEALENISDGQNNVVYGHYH